MISASTDTGKKTSTHAETQVLLRGKWLRLAQVGWIVVFLLGVIVPAVGFWGVLTYPAEQLFAYKQVPLYRGAIATMVLPGQVALYFFAIFLSVLIFARRANDLAALLTSSAIISTGAGFALAVVFVNPWNSALFDLASRSLVALGFISTSAALSFLPTGRVYPRYLIGFLIIWVPYNLLAIPIAPIGVLELPMGVSILVQLVAVGLPVYGLFQRYRDSLSANQRQQIRLVLIGTLSAYVGALIAQSTGLLTQVLENPLPVIEAGRVLFYIARTIFLTMFAIALLRYRLWDIEFLINRSIVYGSMTAGLVAFFGATLYVVSMIVPSDQTLIAGIVTALSAGLTFQPARLRFQKFVDRRFYKINIDYRPNQRRVGAGESSGEQETLKDYRNLRLIGKGGMAEVYLAERPTSQEQVAIKLLPSAIGSDEAHIRRFMREGATLANLEHPNIVRVLDFGCEDDQYYIVMEYLSGQDLSVYLRQHGRLEEGKALEILKPLAEALDYSHQKGIIHRDIKPSNVMLADGGQRVVLMDFGIAKLVNNQTLMTRTAVIGTFDYISPEQIEASHELDGRADIYSLGCLAYHLLTGEPPFKHPNAGGLLIAHMTRPAPDVRQVVPEISSPVAHAIIKAMEKKPENRFTTPGEFLQAWQI
jgi:predicted Ser/Thr protein kinase